MILQPDKSKFSFGSLNQKGTNILGNISWDMRQPLSTASLLSSVEYQGKIVSVIHPLTDKLKLELNDIYLDPPTREVTITLWNRRTGKTGPLPQGVPVTNWNWKNEFESKDFLFTVPDNWPYGMNLWQLLGSIENWINWGRSQYGEWFIGYDRTGKEYNEFGGFRIDNIPNHLTMIPEITR